MPPFVAVVESPASTNATGLASARIVRKSGVAELQAVYVSNRARIDTTECIVREFVEMWFVGCV